MEKEPKPPSEVWFLWHVRERDFMHPAEGPCHDDTKAFVAFASEADALATAEYLSSVCPEGLIPVRVK